MSDNGFLGNLIDDDTLDQLLAELAEQVERTNNNNDEPRPGPSTSIDDDSEHVKYYDIINTEQKHINKFNAEVNQITLQLSKNEGQIPGLFMQKALDKIVNEFITNDTNPRDKVGITIGNPSTTKPIFVSYRAPDQMSAEVILNQFSRVIQSNERFLTEEPLQIKVTKIHMPEGSGKSRTRKFVFLPFEEFCRKKSHSIVVIDNPDDNLCLARSLVVAIAFLNKAENNNALKHYRAIKNNGTFQKQKALELCREAEIDLNEVGGGIEALNQFQNHLKNYKITVYDGSDRRGQKIIFRGNNDVNKYINLIYFDHHYNVITSVKGAFEHRYYCAPCNVCYSNKGEHICKEGCSQCLKIPKCTPSNHQIRCDNCKRYFHGRDCFDHHLKPQFEKNKSVCQTIKYCFNCKKIYSVEKIKGEAHKCDYHICINCKKYVPHDHLCFIKPLKRPKEKETQLFIFFDFECRLDDTPTPSSARSTAKPAYKHIPNYCVLQMQCHKCIADNDVTEDCTSCGKREYIIEKEGNELLDEFFTIIQDKSLHFQQMLILAHNGGGYDFMFLAEYMIKERRWVPELITNGGKIIMMKYEKLEFKDSLNFFHTKLSTLPKMFDIQNVAKGYFPHFFNKLENQNYIGRIPDSRYYGPDQMDIDEREKFFKWYCEQTNVVFDFRKEIRFYCKSDVEILRKACLTFRRLFLDLLHIDPLTTSCTIASACMRAFRTNFLKQDTIPLMTFKAYRMRDNQSSLAVRYIRYIEDKYGVQLQSADRGSEKKFGKYLVDGYCPVFPMRKLNSDDQSLRPLILEVHGCYYHGCPRCYPQQTSRINAQNKKSLYTNMNILYQNTVAKMDYLRNLPEKPHIIEKWECEIYEECYDNAVLCQYMKNRDIITPINCNREAFFGGRTENFYRYYKVQGEERIRYIDVNSLYPFINKYGKYPIGHPLILVGKDVPQTLDGITGIAKVRILPPKKLYLPVLPFRVNNKLIFGLCLTCASEENQGNCTHTNKEREIIGTYTCVELRKAVQLGYIILNIYEVWVYESTQYDKSTNQGGLFTEYINLFLKIKQQASGFPDHIVSDEQKQAFIEDLEKREGVTLDLSKIEKNPGLRSLSKLCLNSLWGKFGQRNNLHQTTIVKEEAKMYELFSDPAVEIADTNFFNDEIAYVHWKPVEESTVDCGFINPILSAHVTAEARVYLYSFLEKLQDRILYCDTDSIIYVERPGDPKIETGPFLGQMGDEMEAYGDGAYITEFVSEGPKNYSYIIKTSSGETKCVTKIRGFTLNYNSRQLLNFDTMKNFVLSSTIPPPIQITDDNKIQRKRHFQLVTQEMTKEYKTVVPKRRKTNTYQTLPYGYVE